ncbi:MAG: tRNA (adenosine(37)-N6)-threonylcarbamoyltransferase complex ATPase subunit type 1 TsaE [Alcaligenaceae bacterium]|jgi:tRNA threonylcarbamoyladenosine biosynthesis protein TsaE|nr:tRNA (adenosine(37)-N6)-threonylcarbamoyltransferase complex ATPase subunit type 1 TsaE [Alcaligenaceae bacterium]
MNQELSHYHLFLADEEATTLLAKRLANAIFPDLSSSCEPNLSKFTGARIYLHGDLGAGKTTFARAFLQALGVTGRIKSPTYTLLESYNVSSLYLYHFDFYRFSDSDEWQEAGFEEQLLDQAIVLVEWSEKANEQLPPPDVRLHLNYQDEGREAVLSAISDKGKQWLNNLNSQTKA